MDGTMDVENSCLRRCVMLCSMGTMRRWYSSLAAPHAAAVNLLTCRGQGKGDREAGHRALAGAHAVGRGEDRVGAWQLAASRARPQRYTPVARRAL